MPSKSTCSLVSICSTILHELPTTQCSAYLVNEEGVETGGLKVHVDEDRVGRLRVGMGGMVVSTAVLTVGDVLLPLALNISVSLIVTKDNGERTTDPGVMLGSSSTLLICVPCSFVKHTTKRNTHSCAV